VIVDDYDDTEEEPLAAWEALLLPDWRWEAFEKEDDEAAELRQEIEELEDRIDDLTSFRTGSEMHG